jgi:hypothetical protein
MSELQLFKNGIPAHLRNIELDETTRALAGVKSGSNTVGGNKRISIKAGVFRMIVDGKEVTSIEDRFMHVIIVAAAPKDARTFYGKAYVEGQEVTAPDCWSNDGTVPDAKAGNPQAKRCLDCKQNVKGSGNGESKACKYSRRIAVLLENDPKGEIFQVTVPAASLWNSENGKLGIKPYSEFLASHGLNVTNVVTEMRFDTSTSSPKLYFKASRALSEDEIALVQQRNKSPEAQRAIGNTAAVLDGARLPAPKVEPKEVSEEDVEPEIKEPVKKEKPKASAPKDVSAILDDWSK